VVTFLIVGENIINFPYIEKIQDAPIFAIMALVLAHAVLMWAINQIGKDFYPWAVKWVGRIDFRKGSEQKNKSGNV